MTRHEREELILDIINNNPGINFRGIMRKAGLANGSTSLHIRKIENKGLVHVERKPRNTRYFPPSLKESSFIASALQRPTTRLIMITLLEEGNDGLDFSQIVQKTNRIKSIVSFYLSQLVKSDVVVMEIKNRKRVYKLKERQIVDQLIEKYHPTLIEKTVDSFTDTFSSM